MYLCCTNYEMTPVIISKQKEIISNTKTENLERNITNTTSLEIPNNNLVIKNNFHYLSTQNNAKQFQDPVKSKNNLCKNN